MSGKKKILVFVDWYSPGYKAGGPITSAVNFVHHLNKDLDIYLFTSDRDLGDAVGYRDILTDIWQEKDQVKLFYASPGFLKWKNILAMVREVKPDVIYLNSMFSLNFTLIPLGLSAAGKTKVPVVLSPRGMLRLSALAQKSLKKKVFLLGLNLSGVMKKVRFHATDQQEYEDILKTFGSSSDVRVMGNLPGVPAAYQSPPLKVSGEMKLIFVGRIHPIKNLDLLLNCLRGIPGKVSLTIAGPLEDGAYWNKCMDIIRELGSGVQVVHHNSLPRVEILNLLLQHHVFVLPTQGENFGHAIFEALASGRPVLISDQTPWRDLASHHAGWDIPLSEKTKFVETLAAISAMDMEVLESWCGGAWRFSDNYLQNEVDRQSYVRLFNDLSAPR